MPLGDHVAAVAVLVLVVAGLVVPLVEATHQELGREDFEDYDPLDPLTGWLTNPHTSEYSQVKVTGQNSPLGSRAWEVQGLTGGVSGMALVSNHVQNGCEAGTIPELRFAIKLDEYPTGDRVYVGISGSNSPGIPVESFIASRSLRINQMQVRLQINETGVMTPQLHGQGNNIQSHNSGGPYYGVNTVSAAPFSPLDLDTWYNVTMRNVACSNDSPSSASNSIVWSAEIQVLELEEQRTLSAGGFSGCRASQSGTSSCGSTSLADYNFGRLYHKAGASNTLEVIQYDNFVWLPGEVIEGGEFIWCSSIGSPQGGYDFLEGVTIKTSGWRGADFETDAGYLFTGHQDDYDYLAKSWGGTGETATGTQAARVYFLIEASTEGTSSIFRVALTNHSATGSQSAPVMDKGTGAGSAGVNSGDFADHVEVEFKEVENDWSIRFYYVHAGADRTLIGQSWQGGNPNTPTLFSFEADTRSGGTLKVRGPTDEILTIGGQPMEYPTPTEFAGATWKGYYFIGAGTNGIGYSARTLVDDKNGQSTCVFDVIGNVAGLGGGGLNGDPGRIIGDGTTGTNLDDEDDGSGGSAQTSSTQIVDKEGVWGMLLERIGPTGAFLLSLAWIALWTWGAYKVVGQAPMIVGGAATLAICSAVPLFWFPIWIPITIAAGGLGTFAAVIAKRIGGARS